MNSVHQARTLLVLGHNAGMGTAVRLAREYVKKCHSGCLGSKGTCGGKVMRLKQIQGYLAHKNPPLPKDPTVALCLGS
jgi:hypothetical protein